MKRGSLFKSAATMAVLVTAAGLAAPNSSHAATSHPARAVAKASVGDPELASSLIHDVFGGPGSGNALTVGQWPTSIRLDGNYLYVSDGRYDVIRRLDLLDDIETVVAGTGVHWNDDGSVGPAPGDGGLATNAPLTDPGAIAINPDGGFTFVDGHRIRTVDSSGVIRTVVGDGAVAQSTLDGTPALLTPLGTIDGLDFNASGQLCFAEVGTYVPNTGESNNDGSIRCLTTAGLLSTLVPGLKNPGGFLFESDGDLVYTDRLAYTVDRRTPDGSTTLLAGDPTNIATSPSQGTNPIGNYITPADIAEAPDGALAIADGWRLDILGTNDELTYPNTRPSDWVDSGPNPFSVASWDGGWLVADPGEQGIFYVRPGMSPVAIAGDSTAGAAGSGSPASGAQVSGPTDIGLLPNGTLVILDVAGRRLRELLPDGSAKTLYFAKRSNIYLSGALAGEKARPFGSSMFVSPTGRIYLLSQSGFPLGAPRVYQVSHKGRLAQLSLSGYNPAGMSMWNNAIAVSAEGDTFFGTNGTVQEAAPEGDVIAWSETGGLIQSVDSLLPVGDEGVLVGDGVSHRIWFISHPLAKPVVFAGSGVPQGADTNPQGIAADEATITTPVGMAYDNAGDVLVADSDGGRVRLITTDGDAYTVAGGGDQSLTDGNGGAALGANMTPQSIAVSPKGEVFVSDNTFANSGYIGDDWSGQYNSAQEVGHHEIRAFYLPEAAAIDGIDDNVTIGTATNVGVAANVPAAIRRTSIALDGTRLAHGRRALSVLLHPTSLGRGTHVLRATACTKSKCVTSRAVHFKVATVRHLKLSLKPVKGRTKQRVGVATVTSAKGTKIAEALIRFVHAGKVIGRCHTNAQGTCDAVLHVSKGERITAQIVGVPKVTARRTA